MEGVSQGDREVEREALRRTVAAEAAQNLADLRPILPTDGEHRPRLDDDLEQLAALVVEIEQIAGENQVTGRRHRQKLGNTFNDTENERLAKEQQIHSGLSQKARILLRMSGGRRQRIDL